MNIENSLQETKKILDTDIDQLSEVDKTTWLVDTGEQLRQWQEFENVSVMVQSQILYTVFTKWEQLSFTVTSNWQNDFYTWAKTFSRRGAIHEPAETTINNKITVYRDWAAEGLIEYPEIVVIPERDASGKQVGEIKVPFVPGECSYGKLLISRGTARKGEMTEKAWSILADPSGTVAELKKEIGLGKQSDDTDDFEIYEMGGIIYATQSGERVPILQILFESEGEKPSLFKRGINYFLKTLGLSSERYEL